MRTMNTECELVPLGGGCVVSLAALMLLLDLERRGFDVRVDPNDQSIVCRPGRLLCDADKMAVQRHREDLRRLVFYCETVQ
jgi:hypothetical protein